VDETDEQRIERISRTHILRDAADIRAWICQPPFARTDEDLAELVAEWKAMTDAAGEFR
jgi:hypothetical protein